MKATPLFKLDLNTAIGIMVLSLPVSIKVFLPLIHSEIIYPAELCIGFLFVWFLYNIISGKGKIYFPDRKFLRHPLTILVFINLIVTGLSAVFSTIPAVSYKAMLVKYCYVFVFYFMMQPLIRSSLTNALELFKLYGLTLVFVVIYTYSNYSLSDLNLNGVNFLSNPFYSDHTIYAAALAFLTPLFIAASFYPYQLGIEPTNRKLYITMAILLLSGLFFSYSRGAWISVFSCVLLLLLIKAGMRFYGIVALSACITVVAGLNITHLKESFKRNKIDSNVSNAGVYEKIFSITNITNDWSNAERLNRWSCALRMFRDKPILGFGPGTYQFQYLTYQRQKEMTGISISTPLVAGSTSYSWSLASGLIAPSGAAVLQGGGGTSHSEYFLALSETGIISFLTFLGLLLLSLRAGLRAFNKPATENIRILSISLLLGLVTYFIHGLFNNFLDDCKLAFLFWFSLATLATIDSRPAQEDELNS